MSAGMKTPGMNPAPGMSPRDRGHGRPSLPRPALLFCPADRPDRYAKALAAADLVVIWDLEDAVRPAAKQAAREALLANPVRPRAGDGPGQRRRHPRVRAGPGGAARYRLPDGHAAQGGGRHASSARSPAGRSSPCARRRSGYSTPPPWPPRPA